MAIIRAHTLRKLFVQHRMLVTNLHILLDYAVAVGIIVLWLHHGQQDPVLVEILGRLHLNRHLDAFTCLPVDFLIVVVAECV